MSTFACEKCGKLCIDTRIGYVTGCVHYPADVQDPDGQILRQLTEEELMAEEKPRDKVQPFAQP